jgi:hypothetical protein
MAEIKKTTTKENVYVDSLSVSKFQKTGTVTAMLRQKVTVTSEYPSSVHDSNMEQNPFGTNDFNDEVKSYDSEQNRVAFIDVPEGMTKEQVQAKISAQACLYRVLSNAPILTDNHQNAISRGLTTKEALAESQVIKYPDGSRDAAGNDNSGLPILDKANKVQYKKIFYWNTAKDDIDYRGSEDHVAYVPESIQALLGVDSVTGEIPAEVILENQEQVIG